jgi:uncharacterized protein (TIGR02996 family)
VGGILYGVFRSVRGLPSTIELATRGRGWGGSSHQLFPLHAEHAIAEDGSPTGLEHAIVYMGEWAPVLQLRARWYDRAGARRFRALLLADTSEKVGAALIEGFNRRFATEPRKDAPYPALAFDLDVIHAIASAATDGKNFVERLAGVPRASLIGANALPAAPFRVAFEAIWNQQSVASPAIADPMESALVEQVRAHPADPAPAHVYADWLDERGRTAEAAAIRPA